MVHPLSALEYADVVDSGIPSSTSGRQYFLQSRALFLAEQRLRTECMSARGQRYVSDPLPDWGGTLTTFDPQPDGRAPRETELVNHRQQWGFGIYRAVTSGPLPDPDPDDRYVATLSPKERESWLEAWFRGPGGGCLHAASAELYGSVGNENATETVPTLVRNDLISQAGRLAVVRRVDIQWSHCVARAVGGQWPNEMALSDWLARLPIGRQRSQAFREMEIRDAVAAVRCGFGTPQAATYAAIYRTEANHLPLATYERLLAAFRIRDYALRRAAGILERRG